MMIAALKDRLSHTLQELTEELTVRIPAQMGEDQRMADHLRTVELQRQIQRRIPFLRRALAVLDGVDPSLMPLDGAGFGSTVRLRDLRTGEELTYTLMTGEGLNLDAGEISLDSPVGHALLGRKDGEEIQVQTPLGRRDFHIVSVATLHDEVTTPGLDARCA
jgi:transcription elongation factor GreA